MFLQLAFNALVSGLLLAMVATGFSLIYNTTKVFHIAHGGYYVAAAYTFYSIYQLFGTHQSMRVIMATLVTFVVIAILAALVELFVYRPVARKQSGQGITLISSMGVYLFMVNTIALMFGNGNIIIDSAFSDSIHLGSLIMAPSQQLQLVTGLISLLMLVIFLKSKWFLSVRATMGNQQVASVLGVNAGLIRMVTIISGSILAGFSGVLMLFDTGLDPQAGMSVTLSAAVAVIIGGSTSLEGTIIAALVIAALQTLTGWWLSNEWKEAVTFAFLILVFFWRTEGIVSYKMRVEQQ